MRYLTGAGFRQALEARIRTDAIEREVSSTRLRKLVAFDRLLARLLLVAPNRWVAKGGLALNLRFGDRTRTTMDLDLARQDSRETALDDLRKAAAQDIGDFFTFEIQRTDELPVRLRHVDSDKSLEPAQRFSVLATLGGRRFEELRVDVGFGDRLPDSPELVSGGDFLAFAGLSPINVPTLPLDEQIAQKVHAYTLTYGSGHPSSREKDLIDLVLICTMRSFEAGRIRDALVETFRARQSHGLPNRLPEPPAEWERGYRRLALEVNIGPELTQGHSVAAAFLDPILSDTVDREAVWDQAGQWI